MGITGAATQSLIEMQAATPWNINKGKGKTFNKVVQIFYNHTTGDSRFEQEKPAMDFFTDAFFLSSDQKSVELMSGYVEDVYNYFLPK